MWVLLLLSILFSAMSYIYIQLTENAKSDDGFSIVALKPTSLKNTLWYLTTLVFGIATVLMLSLFYKADSVFIAKRIFLIALLSPIALTDYKTMKIPNRLICVGLIARVLFILPEIFLVEGWLSELISSAVAAVFGIVICIVCYFLSKGSFGMGDCKLLIMMGLILGVQGFCYSMFFSAFIAFFGALYLLLTKKKNRKDAIPFAPYIFIGTFISLLLSGM